MKRPYLVPILIFCALVLASLTLLWDDDHPAKARHHAIRQAHIKLPPEEVKSRFQLAYEKACSDMLEKNYNDVKQYCLKVLKEAPRRKVSSEKGSYMVGPAALNMLAEVYSAQKDYDAAMESYQQMIALYRGETFQSYQEGEDFWEGKAGAAGMLGQIRILTEFKHDLPNAHNVLAQLMRTYQGQSPKRWEYNESYDSAGA
ncbi:MAG TPA: tetratricopeptide repeat protein, partial [Bacillota bacterium]|nr:tetratricopeptide repeat protein [Bacillota bacterium]